MPASLAGSRRSSRGNAGAERSAQRLRLRSSRTKAASGRQLDDRASVSNSVLDECLGRRGISCGSNEWVTFSFACCLGCAERMRSRVQSGVNLRRRDQTVIQIPRLERSRASQRGNRRQTRITSVCAAPKTSSPTRPVTCARHDRVESRAALTWRSAQLAH
jgi:hypothetical protein